MSPISVFLVNNIIIVYFFYGLSFFVMGLILHLSVRRKSPLKLATAAFRKAVRLSKLSATINESIFCSLIGATRLNTLVVDAFLPLATVAGLLDGVDYWLHWFPGDCPDALRRFLKQSGMVNRHCPFSNGLIQGALGLFLDKGV